MGPDDPDAADGLSGIEEFADVDLEAVKLADADPAAGGEVEGCRDIGAIVVLMDAMVIGLIDMMGGSDGWALSILRSQ